MTGVVDSAVHQVKKGDDQNHDEHEQESKLGSYVMQAEKRISDKFDNAERKVDLRMGSQDFLPPTFLFRLDNRRRRDGEFAMIIVW